MKRNKHSAVVRAVLTLAAASIGGAYLMGATARAAAAVFRLIVGDEPRVGFTLGANAFSKEEVVAFETVLQGFEDMLVISERLNMFRVEGVVAERANNTIWRPQPYIARSFTGLDQSANFARSYAQLSTPISIGYSHSVPLTLTALELRDALQEQRLGKAAMQRLASDVNIDVSNLAALTGSIFIKRSAAATGFDDVAAIDTAMNRLGIDTGDRKAFFSSGDYNNMASNLAGRVLDNSKSLSAYERAFVGQRCVDRHIQAGLCVPLDRCRRCHCDRQRRQSTVRPEGHEHGDHR